MLQIKTTIQFRSCFKDSLILNHATHLAKHTGWQYAITNNLNLLMGIKYNFINNNGPNCDFGCLDVASIEISGAHVGKTQQLTSWFIFLFLMCPYLQGRHSWKRYWKSKWYELNLISNSKIAVIQPKWHADRSYLSILKAQKA